MTDSSPAQGTSLQTTSLQTAANDLKLERASTLFVVMDVQERLVDAMPDECRSVAVDNVIRLVSGARILGLPLVVTEQYPQGLGSTIAPVAQAVEELRPRPVPVAKVDFDGCRDENFLSALDEAATAADRAPGSTRSIVLCGMETHICIYQTARALRERGYAVHVPVDATCCRRIDNHRIAEHLLEKTGSLITSTETVLFDLLHRADSADFKAINKLIR